MFFRAIFVILLSFSVLFCADEDVVEKKKGIEKLGSGKTYCLGEADAFFKAYFEGQLPDSEINKFWNCTIEVTDLLHDLGEGKQNPEELQTAELHRLMRTIVSNKLEHRQLIALMNVKPLLLGGSGKSLRRSELIYAKKTLEEFKQLTLKFKPFAKSFKNLLWGETRSDRVETESTLAATRIMLNSVSKLIARNKKNYKITDLSELLNVFRLDKAESWASLIGQVNNLFIQPQSDFSGDSWPKVFEQIDHALATWVKARASFSSNQKVLSTDIEFILANGASFIENGLLYAREGQGYKVELPKVDDKVQPTAIDTFLDALGALDIVPTEGDGFVLEHYKQIWKLFNRRFIYNNADLNTFSLANLEYTREQALDWIKAEKEIENGLSFDGQKLSCQSQATVEPVDQLKLIEACSAFTLTKNERGFLVIKNTKKRMQATSRDLSENNWIRALVRQFVRAYKKDKSLSVLHKGLTAEELDKAYSDVQPLLAASGLIEKTDMEFHQKMFQEANLFLPSSNGDKNLSLVEFVQYIRFALSALDQSDFLKQELDSRRRCSNRLPEGSYYKDCFKTEFISNFEEYASNFNNFVEYFKKLTDGKSSLLFSLYTTAGSPKDESVLKTEHLVKFVGLLNYIEAIMKRYDTNGTQNIELTEAKKAYDEVFSGVIKKVFDKRFISAHSHLIKARKIFNSEDEFDLRFAAYLYVLTEAGFSGLDKHGKQIDDAVHSIKFQSWSLLNYNELKKVMVSGRLQLASVLEAIAKATRGRGRNPRSN